jgi:hypothetical protein
MKAILAATTAAAALALFAAPALANGSLEDRVARVEQQLSAQSAPSTREIQSAVDAYLASGTADASLVGGPGQAGYDGGFWIRGGTFLLKINLTLQARYEYFDWDDSEVEPSPGGDLSGFSLPRATLKFSGDATCDVHYYAELEFGHEGNWFFPNFDEPGQELPTPQGLGGEQGLFEAFGQEDDILREAWIEYEAAPAASFRMGLIRTAATRQLMTAPELQQFADISLASAVIGASMPGWESRNYDYGFMIHGVLGCDGGLSYMVTVSNGDGGGHRNVVDGFTSDNLAYSARVNWDFMGHMGYEEGALRQTECGWVGAVGAWAHYYSDALIHNPFQKFADKLTWGVDAAIGWGGLSFTGAYSMSTWDNVLGSGEDLETITYLAQIGYLFPGSAFEIAARYSAYSSEIADATFGASEIAGAVTYYIDGHADKVTLDVAWISAEDDGNVLIYDLLDDLVLYSDYPGFWSTGDSDGMLVRLQWQLAL